MEVNITALPFPTGAMTSDDEAVRPRADVSKIRPYFVSEKLMVLVSPGLKVISVACAW